MTCPKEQTTLTLPSKKRMEAFLEGLDEEIEQKEVFYKIYFLRLIFIEENRTFSTIISQNWSTKKIPNELKTKFQEIFLKADSKRLGKLSGK